MFFERIECHTRGILLFTLSGPSEDFDYTKGAFSTPKVLSVPQWAQNSRGTQSMLGPLETPRLVRAPTEAQTTKHTEDAQYKQSLLPYSKHTEKCQ